ncbi:hypothetical protein M3J09_011461 [Ascochyta lentis]
MTSKREHIASSIVYTLRGRLSRMTHSGAFAGKGSNIPFCSCWFERATHLKCCLEIIRAVDLYVHVLGLACQTLTGRLIRYHWSH